MQGDRVLVRCATCHEMLDPAPVLPEDAKKVAGPHAGLRFAHRNLRCAACHDPNKFYDALRLADGRSVPLADAVAVCFQCHGPQARDYAHGAHGGMRGYWDLQRGPRERNTCVSCHDPHAPAYPHYQPAPPPRDRFSPSKGGHD
jgi:hypothetical protein